MPLNLPTNSEVVKSRIKTDIQTRVSLSNPFLKGSWLRAYAESLGERVYDFYFSILQAIDEVFPDTTIGFLDRWGSFYNLSRLAATRSSGAITVQGSTPGSIIPIGHKISEPTGSIFSTTSAITISTNVVIQSTLTQTAGIATFTGTTNHNYNSTDEVTITGAAAVNYNGTFVITVISNTAFTYPVLSGIAASTTGGTFTNISGTGLIQSDEEGDATNLSQFTLMSLQSPIAGVDDSCGADSGGLTGGSNRESSETFRARILDVIRNPVAHFNVSDITRVSKTVSLVTRVFVKEATPAAGQVTIFPLLDNEANPIPGAGTIALVKSAILAIKPANTSDTDVIVSSAASISTSFEFAAISPNTPTMKTSITENLKEFFGTSVEVGVVVTQDAYRSAIFSTIDTTTGEPMISFSLNSPSGDLATAASSIRVIGTVVYL